MHSFQKEAFHELTHITHLGPPRGSAAQSDCSHLVIADRGMRLHRMGVLVDRSAFAAHTCLFGPLGQLLATRRERRARLANLERGCAGPGDLVAAAGGHRVLVAGLAAFAQRHELDHQRQHLHAQGCDAYQGYLMGRPMPVIEFERLIRTNPSL